MQPIVTTVPRTYIQCPACIFEYVVTVYNPDVHLRAYYEHLTTMHSTITQTTNSSTK